MPRIVQRPLDRLNETNFDRAIREAHEQTATELEAAERRAADMGVTLERPSGLIDLAQRFNPAYRADALHRLIAKEIEDALEQRQWLMVFVPPQHGKSELISVTAPADYLGRNPDHYWVAASYAEGLARKHSRAARNIVRSVEYQKMYNVSLSMDSRSVTEWEIAGHRGGFYAVGIGGGLTGRPAHVMAIDDPVANREQAESPTYRDRAWDWWKSTARTRMQPDGVVILVMTRWHYDDLAGRMLEGDDRETKRDTAKWRVVEIPARAIEPDDPLGREEGQVIWPERHLDPITLEIDWEAAEEFYDDLETDMGPKDWGALAQQRPTIDEDAIFKPEYWGYYTDDELPPERLGGKRFLYIIQFWDTAFKEKTTSDYNACVTLGVTGDTVYVLDVYNKRHEMPALLKAAKAQALIWTPTHMAVENKASGPSLAQLIRKETSHSVELWDPVEGGDKVARAQVIVPKLADGRVKLPRDGAPWLGAFLQQLGRFPADVHDDQVDAFVGAMHIVKELWDGLRKWGVYDEFEEATSKGVVDERYIDRDTGTAPNPDLVRRRRP